MYDNTWKCGELKLYLSPSAGGLKTKTQLKSRVSPTWIVPWSTWAMSVLDGPAIMTDVRLLTRRCIHMGQLTSFVCFTATRLWSINAPIWHGCAGLLLIVPWLVYLGLARPRWPCHHDRLSHLHEKLHPEGHRACLGGRYRDLPLVHIAVSAKLCFKVKSDW